jgi:limonene-1,2-epoxide hydrolase
MSMIQWLLKKEVKLIRLKVVAHEVLVGRTDNQVTTSLACVTHMCTYGVTHARLVVTWLSLLSGPLPGTNSEPMGDCPQRYT